MEAIFSHVYNEPETQQLIRDLTLRVSTRNSGLAETEKRILSASKGADKFRLDFKKSTVSIILQPNTT